MTVVERRLKFTAVEGPISRAYLPKYAATIIPARQAVVLQASARPAPDNMAYHAVLEPGEASNLPSSVSLGSCFVNVVKGQFLVTLANESDSDVILPEHACIGTLYHADRVNQEVFPANPALADGEVIRANSARVSATSVSNPALDVEMGVQLTPTESSRFSELLEKHSCVFSTHDRDLGHVQVIKHCIDTGQSPPIRQRYRSLPPSQYQEVRTHIQELLEAGIIRESISPWASPIVVVRKRT